jgi:hypothetical protein
MTETPELRFGYSASPFAAIDDLVDLAKRSSAQALARLDSRISRAGSRH